VLFRSYWEYSTQYGCFALDALETALGRDFGLSGSPGFSATGLFPIQGAGPRDLYFNFADSHESRGPHPAFFWLGRKFNLDACIAENHRLLRKHLDAGNPPDAFDVVWYQPPVNAVSRPPRKACLYRGINTVFLRNRWDDPDAVFAGFKGGSNQADHAHLDLGSFVLDALGVRWAADPGPDDYDIPGYWDMTEGGGRWRLFRLNNHSHNTLVLNDDLQRAEAVAKVVRTDFSDSRSFAIADLSDAYRPHAECVHRGIALTDDGTLIVQDEIIWAGLEKKARWQVLTGAKLELSGETAVFSKSDKSLRAQIASPAGARFGAVSAFREPPENPNEGFQRLILEHRETKDFTLIRVVFSAQPSVTEILPLSAW
jgi:hypothetical protein